MNSHISTILLLLALIISRGDSRGDIPVTTLSISTTNGTTDPDVCRCPFEYVPVCCDGTTVVNECLAACDGMTDCDDGACDLESQSQTLSPLESQRGDIPITTLSTSTTNGTMGALESRRGDIPVTTLTLSTSAANITHDPDVCECPFEYVPVCCDGTTVVNECLAACDGMYECDEGACDLESQVQTLSNETSISCADFNHCASYNNGCNVCQCLSDGAEACTLNACLEDDLSVPHCISCETGYTLNDDGECISVDPTPMPTKQPTVESAAAYIPSAEPTQAPTLMEAILWTCCKGTETPETTTHHNSKLTHEPTEYPTKEPTSQRTCSWFGSACKAYSDGCNYCWCNEDGSESDCSTNTCDSSDLHERRCLECEDGYELNGDTQCVPSSDANMVEHDESSKIACRHRRDSVCNTEWGFRCQADLECRASGATSLMCAQRKVCVEYLDHCESDADCDARSGYQCIAGGMMKRCARYQRH